MQRIPDPNATAVLESTVVIGSQSYPLFAQPADVVDGLRARGREADGEDGVGGAGVGVTATRGAALNHATPFARGSVIVAIDADATVAPDFLERAMRAWRRDEGAAGLQALKRPTNARRSGLTAARRAA